jgi:outer membrane protein OmpA-like peptidoglycan-associated protein
MPGRPVRATTRGAVVGITVALGMSAAPAQTLAGAEEPGGFILAQAASPETQGDPQGGLGNVAELQEEAARLREELAELLEVLAARRLEAGSQALGAGTEEAAPPAGAPVERTVAEVFFSSGGATIRAQDRQRLAGTAEALRALGVQKLRVIGFSDRQGSPQLNEELSLARARAAARELAAAGFGDGVVEALGSTAAEVPLPVPTAEGVAEPLNRRARVVAVVEQPAGPQQTSLPAGN